MRHPTKTSFRLERAVNNRYCRQLMPPLKMHADEVRIDRKLAARLISEQFPQWADFHIAPVESAGTDNTIFRLGANLVIRMPRIKWAVGQGEKERVWLPKLAPRLPLDIPEPVAMGQPGQGYPWRWSIHRWLDGQNPMVGHLAGDETAMALARFIMALQEIDTTGAPSAPLRGAPLWTRDTATREAIAALSGEIDTGAALDVWENALAAPEWDQPPVWFHGDLLPGNLLFQNGRLSAVIDFGGLGIGDPACDLMIAWGLLQGRSRQIFRQTLSVDDAMWARGRGHAMSQAAQFIPYYARTNPVGVAFARQMIGEVLMV